MKAILSRLHYPTFSTNHCISFRRKPKQTTVHNMKTTLQNLNSCTASEFVSLLSHIYEKNTVFAEQVAKETRNFVSITSLHKALTSKVTSSTYDAKLKLINDHPDLANKLAIQEGSLLPDSKSEQKNAGLDQLTEKEFKEFNELNTAYVQKFGFVFIFAVKHATKDLILESFRARLERTKEQEFEEALFQISKIVWMRLLDTIESNGEGFLTTHVLDTYSGKPAAGMKLKLLRKDEDKYITLIDTQTNDDGRVNQPLLGKSSKFSMFPGEYKIIFETNKYFVKEVVRTSAQPFLKEVEINFGIDNPEDHYHVPLLATPWTFSTYRGS
eukprot:snap_masked-scaffold_4-processed-gene-20.5-mRNA-1 protein AED:0.01 eAED:0.01 QI:28/1/1/1/1/1/2/36/326